MSISRSVKVFDYICDFVLLLFLAILITLTTNAKRYFVPVEILFMSVFSIRFFIRRSKLSLYTIWSMGFAFLAIISTTYAPDKSAAMRWAVSIVQVVIFGNLIVPYFRDGQRNVHIFLVSYLVSLVALGIRVLLSAPLEQLMSTRLGESIGVNANLMGFLFVIGAHISLYYSIVERKWSVLPIFLLFSVVSLFSGSRRAIFILLVGIVLLFILSSKKPIHILLALFVSALFVIGFVFLSFHWEPLREILGVRIQSLLSIFQGGTGDGSTITRINMVKTGIEMFYQKPIIGWGLHAFTDTTSFATYSHNNYIEVLVTWGIVGFVWYYSFWLFVVMNGIKLLVRLEHSHLISLSVTLLLLFFIDDFGVVRFYNEISHFFLALGFSVIVQPDSDKGIDIPTLLGTLNRWIRHPKPTSDT